MKEDREINLIDLAAEILSHWRILLILMLAGAVLMGAFSYVRSYQGIKRAQEEAAQQKAETPPPEPVVEPEPEITPEMAFMSEAKNLSREERLKRLEELLKEPEKLTVMAVLDDEQERAKIQQYVEKSVLMKADPYNIPKTELIFRIQVDDMGESYMLRSVYEDLINGVGMLQWVEDKLGIPAESADELISAWAKSNVIVLNGAQNTELGNDCLKVAVMHSNAADCKKLVQCVKDYLEEQHEALERELGEHDVTLLSEASGVVMDTSIRDRQLSYSNSRLSFLISGANTRNGFTDVQRMYYDLLSGGDGLLEEKLAEAEKPAEPVEPAEPAEPVETDPEPVQRAVVSMKQVVLGAFLFVFLYAGVIFVIYIMNGKIRTSDELQRLYGISQLGLVVKEEEKKRFVIDRWVDALRNWNKRHFTREQSLELAAAAVKITAQKQGLDAICLMGCDLKAGADAVCRILQERLAPEKLEIMILDNVLYDAGAMEELGKIRGLVLVEKAMSTMCEEIAQELELAARQGIKVLGGIIVE